MAKNSITQYDTTAASNTDVGNIPIEGSDNVANFDNALREIMKHLADLNTGASFIHDTYKIADSDAETKLAKFDAGSITAGQTRTFTFPDKDGTFALAGEVGDRRNKIINGDFVINQRGGTKTPGTGVYGYDRWKGHASGLEQIVESLPAGEYTLTWSGGGNGTFGGTTSTSPIKETITAGDTSVVIPATATKVSLIEGDTTQDEDPFEPRLYQQELELCRRYYQEIYIPIGDCLHPMIRFDFGSGAAYSTFFLSPPLRDTPTFSESGTWESAAGYASTPVLRGAREDILCISSTATVSANGCLFLSGGTIHLDAEL